MTDFHASARAPSIQRKRIWAEDAWGRVHEADIEWRPERIFGVDPGQENIGMVPVAWADHCPAQLTHDNNSGGVTLRGAGPIQIAGQRGTLTVTPRRIDDRIHLPNHTLAKLPSLPEGSWRVVETVDDAYTIEDIAHYLGVTVATARTYTKRRTFPKAAGHVGSSNWWHSFDIVRWNETRPGQGVGGGRPRSSTTSLDALT